MSLLAPKYEQKTPITNITDHTHLPDGAVEIARIQDTVHTSLFYCFVKNGDHLSILTPQVFHFETGDEYKCFQVDFPMGFLAWFATALSDFQKPPAQGGLHAGAMTSGDQNIDGEMLAIIRAMSPPGYNFVNRSREEGDWDEIYFPQKIYFPEEFIFPRRTT